MNDGFEILQFERHGHVLQVTIDRPDSDLNAVNDQLHDELTRLFPHLQQERAARAVLLTGQLPRLPSDFTENNLIVRLTFEYLP